MAKTVIIGLVNAFCAQIWQFCPCCYQFPNGKLCAIAKALHTTGHYGQKTGEHIGPSPPQDLIVRVENYLRALSEMVSLSLSFHDLIVLFHFLFNIFSKTFSLLKFFS
jgi:hypothetical protein